MSKAISAWSTRYGSKVTPPGALQLNEVLERLLEHRSVRAYLPQAVPEGTLETLIAAAQSASSSSNLQVWSVITVEDPARRARLADLCGRQSYVRSAPMFLVWLADLARLERAAMRHDVPPEGLGSVESLLIGVIDAALAAQNAVLALESLGLASVYIGGIRNDPEAVAVELGLPPRVFPVFGLCVGYADPGRPTTVKPRLSQEAVLHRERYALAEQDAEIERYDGIMREFYATQGMPASQWSHHSVSRMLKSGTRDVRTMLGEVLRRLGFDLR